ncbi:MAG: MBL fold metallo-hydrolase [Rhodobacteraceae bacterium]|nr:MBL fold metallo-hydrolase [Paracoccaceae bacterium]
MMHHRRIGHADVFNITELIGPTHDPAMLYPALPTADLAALVPRLAPAHYAPGIGRLVIGFQIWVVRLGSEVIVVDTGIGNAKPRGLPRFNRLNTLTPAWLAAAGAAPEQVTQVVMTHLHGDHIGGNTVPDGDSWKPAFPNARYLAPKADFDFWMPRWEAAKGVGETEALTDSIAPLVEAGRLEFYDSGAEIAPGLGAQAAPGHTPGMMRLNLSSDGARGVFCADIFHSVLQILRPDINTAIDVLQDVARQTRADFLAEVADTGTLIMPCHFGEPHCGTVAREGEGFRFVPEGA